MQQFIPRVPTLPMPQKPKVTGNAFEDIGNDMQYSAQTVGNMLINTVP